MTTISARPTYTVSQVASHIWGLIGDYMKADRTQSDDFLHLGNELQAALSELAEAAQAQPPAPAAETPNANSRFAGQAVTDEQQKPLITALRNIARQSIGSDWTKEQAFDFMRQEARDALKAAPAAPNSSNLSSSSIDAGTGEIPLRPSDDELWDDTLRDRDAYHQWADKLADAIATYFNVDIGEHSNLNLPWAEALEAIENAEPDHGIEQAAQFIENKRDNYVEEHGIYDRDTGAMEYPGNGLDYVTQLGELVEGIRALKSAAPSTIKAEPTGEQP